MVAQGHDIGSHSLNIAASRVVEMASPRETAKRHPALAAGQQRGLDSLSRRRRGTRPAKGTTTTRSFSPPLLSLPQAKPSTVSQGNPCCREHPPTDYDPSSQRHALPARKQPSTTPPPPPPRIVHSLLLVRRTTTSHPWSPATLRLSIQTLSSLLLQRRHSEHLPSRLADPRRDDIAMRDPITVLRTGMRRKTNSRSFRSRAMSRLCSATRAGGANIDTCSTDSS